MAKMGRPKIDPDWKTFETACKLCATKEEILSLLNMNETTLDRRIKERYNKTFEGVLKEMSGLAKLSLRRNQFAMSKNNATMAIWLGKQYLDQRDKQEIDHTTGGNEIKSIPVHNFVRTEEKDDN